MWKEDESKTKVSGVSLVFREGAKSIEELRGGDVSPVAQPVIFDGKTQVIDADTSIAWRQSDANTYERKLTVNGKLVTTRTLTLSPDEKMLTEKTDQTRADGKPRTVTRVFQRADGQKGLVGRWMIQTLKSTHPFERHIERVGSNRIKYVDAVGVGFTATLDGNPVLVTGPSVITGTMQAVRLTGDRTIQITTSRNGKDLGRVELALSADGKSLTETDRGPHRMRPTMRA